MGWVQKRPRKDGRASYRAYYRDPSRKVRTKTFPRRRDAEAYLRDIEHRLDTNRYRDPALGRISLAAFWDHYIRTAGPREEATRSLYMLHARRHILPRLGSVPLTSITKAGVREFIADLQASGVPPTTTNNVYRLLRRILSVAVDEERLPANPASRVGNLPFVRPAEMRFLTAREVLALQVEAPERYQALILLLAYTGIRIGEASALRMKNIDLGARALRIVEASKEVDGRQSFGPTKTKQNRRVALPAFLSEALARHIGDFVAPAAGEVLVFTSPAGGVLRQHAFRSRIFQPAARRAGLIPPRLRVHDLRHTAVALAIQAGVHPRKIQEMLGHSNIGVTLGTYGHLLATLHEEDSSRLDAIYQQSLGEPTVVPLRA